LTLARGSHSRVHVAETKSIADVVGTGAGLEPHEAVAIIQQLMAHVEDDVELTQRGPPSLDNVRLGSDGSVVCRGCTPRPAVFEIATLLEAMLSRSGKTRVSGALRYTIARALLEVEAPRFPSVADFSAALKRHEKGDRDVVLRALYARTTAVDTPVETVSGERRRRAQSTAELRRQLREADEQLYLYRSSERAVESGPATVPTVIEPAAIELIAERPVEPPVDSAGLSAPRWVLGAAAVVVAFGAGYLVERMTSHAVRSPVNSLRALGRVSQADRSAPPTVRAEETVELAPPLPLAAPPARDANTESTGSDRIDGSTAGSLGAVWRQADTNSVHQIGPHSGDPAHVERNGHITSVYTPLTGQHCKAIKEDKRIGSFAKACPGVAGYRLLITSDDEHMSVTVITDEDKEHPLNYSHVITPGFSSLGTQAEWRIVYHDGMMTPLALIVRVYGEDNDSRPPKKTSYLTVSKLTSREICVTDRIPAGPSANERARQAAIGSAARTCLKPSGSSGD
jgi:hypothetical protein